MLGTSAGQTGDLSSLLSSPVMTPGLVCVFGVPQMCFLHSLTITWLSYRIISERSCTWDIGKCVLSQISMVLTLDDFLCVSLSSSPSMSHLFSVSALNSLANKEPMSKQATIARKIGRKLQVQEVIPAALHLVV